MSERYLQRSRNYFWLILGDGLLLLAAFMAVYTLRRGHLWIEPEFQYVVPWMFAFWLVFTLLSGKFMQRENPDFVTRVRPFLQVGMVLTGAVSLLLYLHAWYHVSRFITYGTLGLFLGLELVFLTLNQALTRRLRGERSTPVTGILFLLDVFLVLLSFALVYRWHRGSLLAGEDFPLLLLGLVLAWLASALLTHRFRLLRRRGGIPTLVPFWKGEVLLLLATASFLFITDQSQFSRTIVLGSILVFCGLESMAILTLWMILRTRSADDTAAPLRKAPEVDYGRIREREMGDRGVGPYRIPESPLESIFLREQLRLVYLAGQPDLFHFMDENIDMGSMDVIHTAVMETSEPDPVGRIADDSLEFMMNLHRVNDFRRVNHFFLQAHRALRPNGVLVLNFESLRQRRERFLTRHPLPIARVLLLLDFAYRRAMPRLPVLKKIYFALSRGRNRVLSFTECLGRMFYCGFDVVSWKEINGRIHFIMRKAEEPERHKTPSYGPLFRQRRIGRNNRILHIYKFRTMHPYSEYLQKYIQRHHRLAQGGKIRDDFRVTTWGRFMRRTLLDELPMLINWVRGDLKLVGVRPLSEAFFATYPEDLKILRKKVKPGLVPPFYADMPDSIEEVWESERRYLDRYARRRLRTDIAYFFRALSNILFNRARSA